MSQGTDCPRSLRENNIDRMTKMKLTEEVKKKQNLACIRLYNITSEIYFKSVLSASYRGTL